MFIPIFKTPGQAYPELHILKIKNIECVHKIPSYSLGDRGKYHCTIISLHEVFMKFLLSLAAVEYGYYKITLQPCCQILH